LRLCIHTHSGYVSPDFEIDPDEIDGIHDGLFESEHEYTLDTVDEIWGHIRQVYHEGDACHDLQKDENAWAEVARSVL
jgi:hypothetical protein